MPTNIVREGLLGWHWMTIVKTVITVPGSSPSSIPEVIDMSGNHMG